MPNKRRQNRSLSRNLRSHSSQHDSRYRRRSPSSNILTETMQQILNRLVLLEEQQVVSSSHRKEPSGRAAVEVARSAVPVATISTEAVPAVEPAVSMPPPSQLSEAVTASSLQGRAGRLASTTPSSPERPASTTKVLAQSEQLVLKDRELKETRNLYGAVKDMLALQPSPEIQQTLNRTQRALAQRTTKMKCLIAELAMRENQVTDLRRELDRTNGDLHSFKQKYYEMKRALDADEARRLKVPTPLHPTTPTLQEIT
ncbi:Coiled-coil domain-containing protein 147 [Papilio xuthus]|uniref:Coiled-coil domain-containing protein 147 n=1 Tax=Papilio xuthus TaxID=66420 RepID=A0A194QCE9_PAPXU|nr:Coiled-coil domain-containing protein 147 [Papilio xuthus]